MPNPEEDRHANRSEKSSFKPAESDQFQIGPRTNAFSAAECLRTVGSWLPPRARHKAEL